MNSLNRAKWLSLIIGIMLILLGVIFLVNPMESIVGIVNLIGIFLMAMGILKFIRYFSDPMFKTGIFLVGSILDILLGILIIRGQPYSVVSFTSLVGFWQLFTGISEIAVSIDLKNFRMPRWGLVLLSGILGVLVGYFILTDQAFSTIYISTIIALYFILSGITFISTFFGLNKLSRRY